MATWLCKACASKPRLEHTNATPVSSQELSYPITIIRRSVQLGVIPTTNGYKSQQLRLRIATSYYFMFKQNRFFA
jgi:hypothetical protein